MDSKVQKILSQMTLADKISLCNGADFWHSKAMEKYGIPAITMSDGPHGLRCLRRPDSDSAGNQKGKIHHGNVQHGNEG